MRTFRVLDLAGRPFSRRLDRSVTDAALEKAQGAKGPSAKDHEDDPGSATAARPTKPAAPGRSYGVGRASRPAKKQPPASAFRVPATPDLRWGLF
ncbi:hypothetical protein GCM10011578_001310 [Streptomyces fuscichromogenes]|uniref:Uncharacterized protein n=1 Tax=Streptomyces fuscichromogenes TaxID=1324013 RepID=A0A917UDU1_9ACTN|nr:hypothetical protein GCM10011578_001310 [Streptomyces fuscichromogenes]